MFYFSTDSLKRGRFRAGKFLVCWNKIHPLILTNWKHSCKPGSNHVGKHRRSEPLYLWISNQFNKDLDVFTFICSTQFITATYCNSKLFIIHYFNVTGVCQIGNGVQTKQRSHGNESNRYHQIISNGGNHNECAIQIVKHFSSLFHSDFLPGVRWTICYKDILKKVLIGGDVHNISLLIFLFWAKQ